MPGVQRLLVERKAMLDNFFRSEELEFEITVDGEKMLATRPFYYCHDIQGFFFSLFCVFEYMYNPSFLFFPIKTDFRFKGWCE